MVFNKRGGVLQLIIQGTRNDKNIIYRKLRHLWRNMIDRCYNEKHPAYKNYGAKGVIVCDEWKTLDGFIETIDKVAGWEYSAFINGELALDKDRVKSGNKVYAPELCCFVTKEENNRIKPNQQRIVIATSPSGEQYEFSNQSLFAKQHNLRQSTIADCLSGRVKKHKGWTFRYK